MRPTIACAKCSSPVEWGDKFCGNCGTVIDWPGTAESPEMEAGQGETRQCPECGTEVEPGVATCPSCGHSLTGQARRKVQSAKREKKGKTRSAGVSLTSRGKMIAGAVVVVIGGAVVWEMTTSDRTGLTVPQSQSAPQQPTGNQSQQLSPNMEALPEIEEMEQRLAANPNEHQLILTLANVLHDNRFLDKAIVYYKRYLEHHPDDADALVDVGICYNDLNQLDEAKQWMQKALVGTPNHLLAHFNLGIVSLRAGNVEEANEWFRKTVNLAPNSTIAQRARELLTPHSNLQNTQ